MRKAVTATRRSKDKRQNNSKEDEVSQLPSSSSQPNHQQTSSSRQPAHLRDRDEQFAPQHPNSNTVTGSSDGNAGPGDQQPPQSQQQQRKPGNDEAALQAKNYRLAKELVSFFSSRCNERRTFILNLLRLQRVVIYILLYKLTLALSSLLKLCLILNRAKFE